MRSDASEIQMIHFFAAIICLPGVRSRALQYKDQPMRWKINLQ